MQGGNARQNYEGALLQSAVSNWQISATSGPK